jgi:hypothetical protein
MLKQQQQAVKLKRNMFLGLGFYYMMRYFVGLLRYNMVFRPYKICNNYTSVFSCVPGPIKAWVFLGHEVREMFYVVPGVGDLGCGIGVITYWDFC